MPRKNEEVTHVRISKDNLMVLDTIRIGKETNRQVLNRLMKDYDNNGIRRQLVKVVSELQLFVNNYIHEDFHHCLEILKAIMIKVDDSTNRIEKAEICKIVLDDLSLILNKKIGKIKNKNNPDKIK